jgi:spore coat polysaccharide biosynthesis protein SpsF
LIVAIVQARMNSKRLPGKVLLPVNGVPVIDYVFSRVGSVKEINKVVLATTTNGDDDPLIEFAENNSVSYFRGSENDVLERFYLCALQEKADYIMRITSDCPLIDPSICSHLIKVYKMMDVDYVNTGSSFAEGLDCELFTFKALKRAYLNAKLSSEREHVTMYLHNNPEEFNIYTLENNTDDSRYRFTLDQDEDYQVICAIIESLAVQNIALTTNNIKVFLDNNREIFNLNQNILRNEGLQKSLNNDSMLVFD